MSHYLHLLKDEASVLSEGCFQKVHNTVWLYLQHSDTGGTSQL